MLLGIIPETRAIPISLEWTVPYLRSVFHLGIHNLPGARAQQLSEELQACTAEPSRDRMCDLLQTLHSIPSVLVVLNHPLWKLKLTSPEVFQEDLCSFLGQCGNCIHAFEVNGLRPWEENMEVMKLATRWNQLVISGGDRHGCEPSANINLTNAASFAEWVEEIRQQRCSRVLFLPQYDESRPLRIYHTFLDAIREYPSHVEGLCRWDERTFYPDHTGEIQCVASLWREPPKFLQLILGAALLTEGSLILETVRRLAGKSSAKLAGIAGQEGTL